MSASPDPAQVVPTRPLPSGTVTFAFTDIEGSTGRWERYPVPMAAAVRRHDELLRATVAAHGGYVFKTIGDAFCVAFSRPADAVAAMLDAQRTLAAEDFSSVDGIRVRAAIHTGATDERDGDYFGAAVNRVARLLAIGHGGQVLVSGVTADIVQSELPPQASLRDLGEHRLRDLARPEYVHQLVAPELAADFPPLRSLDTLPNNLPLQLTSFLGREREVGAATALIEKHRLVTLVGAGGVGKTRTSLQVAANMLDGSGDGVWFIELAPLSSGEYIPTTIAQAMGLTLPVDGVPLENLVRALKGKRTLLVFDNCEHMVEAAARAVAAILRGCPQVKILASSRQGLGIEGEATLRMPSLVLPTKDEALQLGASDAAGFSAIALFAERAQAANDGFILTDENAPAVADICRRLDGIPLAIELAAARVKMFSPQQVRERLNERFRMLTGGSRDVLPRQQTLRALIDWSHDLLDERERALFRRLGIFVNGFTLEGAVAVGAGEEIDEFELFDVLGSLVDKSLVLAEPRADAVRYRLLESTRVYAFEKLTTAAEVGPVAGRALRYLRDRFAELRERFERIPRATELTETLQTELEDVRSALAVALARSDVVEGAELLAAVGTVWRNAGLEAEGVALCETYIDRLSPGESRLLARLSGALSHLLLEAGKKERAFEFATAAVTHARVSGDPATLAAALFRYAHSARFTNRLDEAETVLAEAESIPEPSANLRLGFLLMRGFIAGARGDFEASVRLTEEVYQLCRLLGDPRSEAIASMNLAEAEFERGQTERAIAVTREVLVSLTASADKILRACALSNLAGYLLGAGEVVQAASAAREVIAILGRTEPDHVHVAVSLGHLALAIVDDPSRAATLRGYVDAAFARHGYQPESTEQMSQRRLALLLDQRLAPEEREHLFAQGAALTAEAAIALALGDAEPAVDRRYDGFTPA